MDAPGRPAPSPRDPPCPWCDPHPMHLIPCDRSDCACTTGAWHHVFPDPDYPLTDPGV